jgi:ABC-type glycerol-3-phosphate transport system substrate-binding protein
MAYWVVTQTAKSFKTKEGAKRFLKHFGSKAEQKQEIKEL